MQLGHAKENCREAILVLGMESRPVRSVDVANYLGLAKPTVCVTLKSLADLGYVEKTRGQGSPLTLTASGRTIAEETYAKHCFFREWLVWAGVDEETAEQEACALEHGISFESFRTLRRALSGLRASAV